MKYTWHYSSLIDDTIIFNRGICGICVFHLRQAPFFCSEIAYLLPYYYSLCRDIRGLFQWYYCPLFNVFNIFCSFHWKSSVLSATSSVYFVLKLLFSGPFGAFFISHFVVHFMKVIQLYSCCFLPSLLTNMIPR